MKKYIFDQDDNSKLQSGTEMDSVKNADSEVKILSTMAEAVSPKIKSVYVSGELKSQDKNALAVVGSRKMTEYGKKVCEYFVGELAAAGVTIVSGLMYGVDMCAHSEALRSGGRTIAVLGYGFDYLIKQKYATEVSNKIINNARGAILSECDPSQPPTSFTFPRRNRIIAGLSKAVLIVEAGAKSGSLLTADYALNQGKDVYIIPGSIFSSQSFGKHEMIKKGATLVDDPYELMEMISWEGLRVVANTKSSKINNNSPDTTNNNPQDTELSFLTTEENYIFKIFINQLETRQKDISMEEIISLSQNKFSFSQIFGIISSLEIKDVISKKLDQTFEVNAKFLTKKQYKRI